MSRPPDPLEPVDLAPGEVPPPPPPPPPRPTRSLGELLANPERVALPETTEGVLERAEAVERLVRAETALGGAIRDRLAAQVEAERVKPAPAPVRDELREAVSPAIERLAELLTRLLEEAPPEEDLDGA